MSDEVKPSMGIRPVQRGKVEDVWQAWQSLTAARIALGRAGGSLPTGRWLEFNLAHSRARDAVHEELDANLLCQQILQLGFAAIVTHSAAANRQQYLQYPNLGRSLGEGQWERLSELVAVESTEGEPCDLAVIVADGLSSPAAQRHAVPVLAGLLPMLQEANWKIGPVVVATQARVALQDAVGQALRAKIALILIGERPGLSSPDSLGAYLIHDPKIGSHDAQRNCVSNIRPEGLAIANATQTLFYLLTQCKQRHISGIMLKDERAEGLKHEAPRIA